MYSELTEVNCMHSWKEPMTKRDLTSGLKHGTN